MGGSEKITAHPADRKKIYDADAVSRLKSWSEKNGEYQFVGNSNLITIFGKAPGMAAITNVMANPDLKPVMEKAEVRRMPDVKILS